MSGAMGGGGGGGGGGRGRRINTYTVGYLTPLLHSICVHLYTLILTGLGMRVE